MVLTADLDSLGLIPPARLGRALAEARLARGLSLDTAAAASGRFTPAELSAIERGEREVNDLDVIGLARIYGLEAGRVVPQRSRLVIDLHGGTITAGDETERIGRRVSVTEGVLTRYLALVYRLRDLQPGTPIRLRQADLSALSEALWLEPGDVEARLVALMKNSGDVIGRRSRLLGRRLVLPTVGILVAVTTVGTLVLERQVGASQAANESPVGSPGGEGSGGYGRLSVDSGEGIVVEVAEPVEVGTPRFVTAAGGQSDDDGGQVEIGEAIRTTRSGGTSAGGDSQARPTSEGRS